MKNEEDIKDMIVLTHKRGACDSSGESVKTRDGRFIAKPKTYNSASKTYVCRDGEIVLKYG